MTSHSNTPQWLIYALSSGFCAALNGVFAKLTTTQLTSTWATAISTALGGGGGEEEGGKFVIIVEGLVRGVSSLFSLYFCYLFFFYKDSTFLNLQISNSSSSSLTSSSTPSCGVYSPMHSVWHPVPSE